MASKQDLMAMGFEEARVDWALSATKNGNMDVVLDHIESNAENQVPDISEQAEHAEQVPASIRCDDCNKLFKDQALAGYHAEKSGHASFSQSTEEIKPLTEDEKAERLQQLKSKMDEKRKVQAEAGKEDDKRNELIRVQRGKEDQAVREELKAKELKKDLEKKKKEKEEDKKAMARVKQQIEADKRERAEKAAKDKALREGKVDTATPAQPSKPVIPKVSTSNATDTRLQLRTPSGPLTTTLKVDNTLTDVSDFIATQQMVEASNLTFSTTFPARTFTDDEMNKSLKQLDLVPSAALIVKFNRAAAANDSNGNLMSRLSIYEQKPPNWRLPISSTSLEYPDYQPPIPGKDEDIINQSTVRNGYTAPPAVQNETFSCHQLIIDSLQTNNVAQNLNFIFKSALDIRHTRNHPQSNYIRDGGGADAHIYFQQLASPEIPLQSLLKLPRNLKPESILNHLEQHHVDPQRSVWLVKLASRQSSNYTQLSMEWSNLLTQRLSSKLVELPIPESTSTPNGSSTTNHLNSHSWLSQFSFLLDILRAFIANGLLDSLTLHQWLLNHLKHIHLARLPLIATLALENIEAFYSSHQLSNVLVAAACRRIIELRVAHANEHLTCLARSLERIIVLTFDRFSYSFISPKLWLEFSPLFQSLLHTHSIYPEIKLRNNRLLYGNKDKAHTYTHYCPRQSLMRDINVLDSINTHTNIRALALDFFEPSNHSNARSFTDKVNTLLEWAVSDYRSSQHRCYAVATLLRFYVSLQLKLNQKTCSKDAIKHEIQHLVFVWLEGESKGRRECDIHKLLSELVRRRVFNYSLYMQHIIASGLMANPKKKAIHSNVLLNMPLFDASISVVNLRRMAMDCDVNASCEKSMENLTRNFRALLPRLYKKTESIPAITTLDLENTFSPYKKLPLFYQYRAIHSNLLPSVAAFTDAKTGESRLGVEELATIISILEYFEDYASVHALIEGLLPTINNRQVLFLLMDAIRRSWTVLVSMNAMAALTVKFIAKYDMVHSSGGQVRPLVLLLVTAREHMQLPAHLERPVQEAVSSLEKSLTTTVSSSAPPRSIADVQMLLHDNSAANAADLATTLWYRHSAHTQWGASVWEGVLDALRVGHARDIAITKHHLTCFAVFLHEVNNRAAGGLERYITASLAAHPQTLLGGELELSDAVKSIVVQMVVRRVVQTTAFIEDVYLPLMSRGVGAKVVVCLNNILLAVLAPETQPPMVLSDYQHLVTRRGKAYRQPHLARLAQVLPTLVALEVGGSGNGNECADGNPPHLSESAKNSCSALREALSAQKVFAAACMRNMDTVYDALMSRATVHTQQLSIDTLKALTSFGPADTTDCDIAALTSEANPWTFCRHKIALRIVLNYGSHAQTCRAVMSDLLPQMQANGLVKDMLRGINGRAGTEVGASVVRCSFPLTTPLQLANMSFDKILRLLLSLKNAIDANWLADESRVAAEIYATVESISDVLLFHKAVLPAFDKDIYTNTVTNLTSCFHAIFAPREEALENGEVIEDSGSGSNSDNDGQSLEVLCKLLQLLLRTPDASTDLNSPYLGLGDAVLPYLLRRLTAVHDETTYDTAVAILDALPETPRKAFDAVDTANASLSSEVIRLLPPPQTPSAASQTSHTWELLDQIPESEGGDRRVQFNAPQLHKWLDARLVNDHLLHANKHIPLEYERNVPGDGLEAGPVLAYQFRRSLRTVDQIMDMNSVADVGDEGSVDADGDLAFHSNLKKRKADGEEGGLSNGSVDSLGSFAQAIIHPAQPLATTTTQARRTSHRRRITRSLLTETKPVQNYNAFVGNLVSLKITSGVHAKRLDALCASVQSVADKIEFTSSASGFLIVKGKCDCRAKDIGKLVYDKLDRLVLDDITNASGWLLVLLVSLVSLSCLRHYVLSMYTTPNPE
ncbi:hypothetical protein E3P84_02726 [Wallemia ichthyophaga]|nr:hypothetical protein E3P84_02726 [Wallemia ichthyophaga]TIB40767.1 hypothetical protein E3P83_02663 [Wallemia ichthyophaga]